jgi:hypothetical protein
MPLPALGDHPFEILSAVMTYKLLGPSAIYLGGKTKELAQKAVENIERVFVNATNKLGPDIDKEGTVPPRVLKGTMNEAAFCEDAIATEYLGGVLASSRRDSSRDDRGVVMNALIGRLSSYQLRTHYIFYHACKALYDGKSNSFLNCPDVNGVFFPMMCYYIAMGYHEDVLANVGNADEEASKTAFQDLDSLFTHIFFGLHREGLISGFREMSRKGEQGIECSPSPLGVELFLWAYGLGAKPLSDFLNPANTFKKDESIILVSADNPLVIEDATESAKVPGYCSLYSSQKNTSQKKGS